MTRKVVIIHYAAPPIVGGVESTIFHHARFLLEAGYQVMVVAGRGDVFHPQVEFKKLPEVDSRHPEVLEVGKSLAQGNVSQSFFDLRDRIADSIYPILTNAKVCIVHNAITLHKNIPLTAALHKIVKKNQIRMIAWCHDFAWQDQLYAPDLYAGYPWSLMRQVWPGVIYVVVSQHRQKRLADLMNLPEKKIQVVTPGIDISEFLRLTPLAMELVNRLDLFEAAPLMLLPARITRRKNIEYGIRVVASLVESLPKTRLIVTGPPGPHNPKNRAYLQELTALTHTLGVVSNVQFLYHQEEGGEPLKISDAVMADLYRLSDLLFFPSFREGFGIPVLEAGLSRIPVFAADIPPVQESAGDWAHLFDPRGHPSDVAEQIIACLNNDPAYQLRKRVIEKFTWTSIVRDRLIPLIQHPEVV